MILLTEQVFLRPIELSVRPKWKIAHTPLETLETNGRRVKSLVTSTAHIVTNGGA